MLPKLTRSRQQLLRAAFYASFRHSHCLRSIQVDNLAGLANFTFYGTISGTTDKSVIKKQRLYQCCQDILLGRPCGRSENPRPIRCMRLVPRHPSPRRGCPRCTLRKIASACPSRSDATMCQSLGMTPYLRMREGTRRNASPRIRSDAWLCELTLHETATVPASTTSVGAASPR